MSDNETVKIKGWIDTGFAGCRHEDVLDTGYTLAEWREMDNFEREAVIDYTLEGFLSNRVTYDGEILGEAADV